MPFLSRVHFPFCRKKRFRERSVSRPLFATTSLTRAQGQHPQSCGVICIIVFVYYRWFILMRTRFFALIIFAGLSSTPSSADWNERRIRRRIRILQEWRIRERTKTCQFGVRYIRDGSGRVAFMLRDQAAKTHFPLSVMSPIITVCRTKNPPCSTWSKNTSMIPI